MVLECESEEEEEEEPWSIINPEEGGACVPSSEAAEWRVEARAQLCQ